MSAITLLQDQIKSFLVSTFPLARKRGIDCEVPLLESGIVDSMGVLDLVTFLEQTFHIKISDEELTPENFYNLQRLAAFVDGKLGQNPYAK